MATKVQCEKAAKIINAEIDWWFDELNWVATIWSQQGYEFEPETHCRVVSQYAMPGMRGEFYDDLISELRSLEPRPCSMADCDYCT